jgi:uncharacterized protein YuzE
MTRTVSLQITYQGGRPLAAYLYLASNGSREVARSEEVGADLVVDYSAGGSPVGIEILSPAATSLEDVWVVCDRLGIERPSADDLSPLSAA